MLNYEYHIRLGSVFFSFAEDAFLLFSYTVLFVLAIVSY